MRSRIQTGLSIPIFFIRDVKVVGLIPNNSAAPSSPEIFHLVRFRAAMMFSRSRRRISSSVMIAGSELDSTDVDTSAALLRLPFSAPGRSNLSLPFHRRNHGSFNDILQLANVARPIVTLQLQDVALRQSRRVSIQITGRKIDEVGGKDRDIFLALAERGDLNRERR